MRNFGNLNNWTKTDLARVIVQANKNLDKPANSNNPAVKKLLRLKKDFLITATEAAIETISRRQFQGLS